MVAERHRLAPLQMGVAGEERVRLRLGDREHDERERLDLLPRLGARVEHVEPERGRDLVVARPAGMDLPPDVAELTLDRAVDVLVLGEIPGRVERDLGEAFLDLGQLVVRQQAGAVQPPGVLEARLAVVGEKLGVVRVEKGPDRRIERAADAARPERHVVHSVGEVRGELGLQLPRRRAVLGGDEDRVVAGERSGDRRVGALVDRLGERARVARRRRHDDEPAARRLDARRVAPHRGADRAQPVGIAGAGRGIDQPPARGPHLDEAELRHVTRDRRLDDVVALVPERLHELGLGRERPVADEPENRVLTLAAVHDASTPSRIASA